MLSTLRISMTYLIDGKLLGSSSKKSLKVKEPLVIKITEALKNTSKGVSYESAGYRIF